MRGRPAHATSAQKSHHFFDLTRIVIQVAIPINAPTKRLRGQSTTCASDNSPVYNKVPAHPPTNVEIAPQVGLFIAVIRPPNKIDLDQSN
jgi:hypothetical protein